MSNPQQQRQSAALSSYYNTLELNSKTRLLSKEVKIIFEGNFRTENNNTHWVDSKEEWK